MIPLQNATEWTQGDWMNAVWQPYVSLLGQGMTGTILAGALILAFWIHTGDIVMPSILVLLLGGILTAALPGQIVGIARAMVVVGLTTALLAAGRRYVLG